MDLVFSCQVTGHSRPRPHDSLVGGAGNDLLDGGSGDDVVVVFNFSTNPISNYRIGLPHAGRWREILNTDAAIYGGSGMGNLGQVFASDDPLHGLPASAALVLPPLATIYLEYDPA